MNTDGTTSRGDIVYLSRVPWDSLYQRPQHLAAGLAETFRVLFVDTPRSTFYRRFVRPVFTGGHLRPFLRQPAPGLTVLSPAYLPFLPGHWPPPGQYAFSRLFLHWAMRRLGMTSPVLWLEDPCDAYFLAGLAPQLLCYDCMDDYALIAPTPSAQPVLRQQEAALLGRADMVFASAQELARRCSEHNPRVLLVQNGVDADAFSPAAAQDVAADVTGIPPPRLGYVGAIAPWLDLDLLAGVALARPQWSIVMVGPVLGGVDNDVAALRKLPNVHLVGERPYAAIPSYLRGFDVCLIPFRLNDLTRVVNPVKFYEYMAAGRPVVATPLPELQAHAAVCSLATGADGFIAGIEAALANGNSSEQSARRLAVARANDWQQRVQTVTDALQQALAARQNS